MDNISTSLIKKPAILRNIVVLLNNKHKWVEVLGRKEERKQRR
jgi:hypothetical protein